MNESWQEREISLPLKWGQREAEGEWFWGEEKRNQGFLYCLPLVFWVNQVVRLFLLKEEPGAGVLERDQRFGTKHCGEFEGGQLENNTKYVGILNAHWGPTRWLRSVQHQYPDLVRFDRPQDFQEEGLGTVKGARRSRQIEREVMSELWWWNRKKRGGEDVGSVDISGRIAGSEVLAVGSFER